MREKTIEASERGFYIKAGRKYLKKYLVPFLKDSGFPVPKTAEGFAKIFENLPEKTKKKIKDKIAWLDAIGRPSICYYSISIPLKITEELYSRLKNLVNQTYTTTKTYTKYQIIEVHYVITKTEKKAIFMELKYETEFELISTLVESIPVKRTLPVFIRVIDGSCIVEVIGKKTNKAVFILMSILRNIKEQQEGIMN